MIVFIPSIILISFKISISTFSCTHSLVVASKVIFLPTGREKYLLVILVVKSDARSSGLYSHEDMLLPVLLEVFPFFSQVHPLSRVSISDMKMIGAI